MKISEEKKKLILNYIKKNVKNDQLVSEYYEKE